MKNKLWIILLTLFFVHLAFRVFLYRENYTKKLDGEYWKERYEKSQWVVANSKNPIGDDGLYAYDGWVLLRGGDPSLVNPEVPPLGKYLIGICLFLFNNNNIFGLITGLMTLGAFYLFNTQLFKQKLYAFIPVLLFSLEPLYFEQLQASYIDCLYLTTLFMSFFFFLKRKYILFGIFVGLFASIKFSPLFILVPAVFLVYIFLRKQYGDLQRILASFLIPPCILLLSYGVFFLNGKNLLDFLKLQKYIYVFYAIGAKSKFIGMVFPMLFFNEWHTWWDGVQRISQWTISWCILPFISAISVTKFRALIKSPVLLCALWSIGYITFLLFIPVYPRYLLLLLPFLYNVSIWAILESTPKKFLPQV